MIKAFWVRFPRNDGCCGVVIGFGGLLHFQQEQTVASDGQAVGKNGGKGICYICVVTGEIFVSILGLWLK